MHIFAAFILGVALTGLALAAFSWGKARYRRYRHAATLTDNKVTTVSQILHLAVQGSPTGVTVVDRSGGVVLSNERAHDMGVVHERTINEKVWVVAERTFDDKEEHFIDFTTSRKTGSRVTSVRAVVKPLTLIDDRYAIIYTTDESENVRMESARRDFVANVSHELKTPVGGMGLLAEALASASDDPEQVEYFAHRLYKEAHRLGEMISELISLSKLQGAEALPEMEPVFVDEIIEEALARNVLAAEGADIRFQRCSPCGLQVLADRSLLVTAVSNLVSNAINYSPNGSKVAVSAKLHARDIVLIEVEDHGIGIAPEHQQRVFERFFRVDKARSRSTGGTGLGLAIVKHVAANHGGRIRLWSRPGSGSIFSLELPVFHPDDDGDIQDREVNASLFRAPRLGGRRKETPL
ncbi:ATP-binding protein [Corynebacterium felinum]|uniref:Sensor-like histidine kinase SenX3 n=1 Tax=Corynebacterium felinum TaxID=131318 RepID=A0ABU2B7F2_9CORY|nr:ATP-binding protein [Corynebacterium felinum]MDF5819976.1 ATP-binding protein [Corynebacterium felinum]MDR7354537.1 two-component system sensor histidine kinase SenX3 [Corynebacterium felinum]WJY93904.1 Signal-transduction histidine kinase senX3 [Corynebacterium felinum]